MFFILGQKIKIKKKIKKTPLEKSSFYICVPKTMITWCMVPEIWCTADGWTDMQNKYWITLLFMKASFLFLAILLSCMYNKNTSFWGFTPNPLQSSLRPSADLKHVFCVTQRFQYLYTTTNQKIIVCSTVIAWHIIHTSISQNSAYGEQMNKIFTNNH